MNRIVVALGSMLTRDCCRYMLLILRLKDIYKCMFVYIQDVKEQRLLTFRRDSVRRGDGKSNSCAWSETLFWRGSDNKNTRKEEHQQG